VAVWTDDSSSLECVGLWLNHFESAWTDHLVCSEVARRADAVDLPYTGLASKAGVRCFSVATCLAMILTA
jgi:hypothetical protein